MSRFLGWILLPLFALLLFSGWQTWQQAAAYERQQYDRQGAQKQGASHELTLQYLIHEVIA